MEADYQPMSSTQTMTGRCFFRVYDQLKIKKNVLRLTISSISCMCIYQSNLRLTYCRFLREFCNWDWHTCPPTHYNLCGTALAFLCVLLFFVQRSSCCSVWRLYFAVYSISHKSLNCIHVVLIRVDSLNTSSGTICVGVCFSRKTYCKWELTLNLKRFS